jgi:glycosyltransferase involved in cell wall biosynthesis
VKRRLVVITEIIAPYRIPVFNALAMRNDIDFQVAFLSETDPSLRQWRVYKDEIQFHYTVLPAFRWRLGKYNLLINRGVHTMLDRMRPESILCGGYNYLASWQALRWAEKHGVPFLLWSESTAADQRRRTPIVEFFKRRFLSRCSGFVVPGKASAEYLHQFAISDSTIFRAPNAVDHAFFVERAQRARVQAESLRKELDLPQRYFVYVGRLVRAKGVFELVEAYAKLDAALRGKIGLVLVGDGRARSELEQRASRVQPGAVRFAGFVQKENLVPYYALADAVILPTHSDTWGFVVNEAMACACPIIVSAVAGCVPDLVEEDWNGKIIPAHDVGQITSAMKFLSEHDQLRLQMATRSAQRIDGYTPEKCAAGIAQAVAACA